MTIINLTHVTPGKVLLTEFDSDDFDCTLGIYNDEMTRVSFKSNRNPILVKESPKQISNLISESKKAKKSDNCGETVITNSEGL